MTKYKITNRDNGLEFEMIIEGDLSSNGHQPEWGKNPIVVKTDLTSEIAQKEAAKDARKRKIKGAKAANSLAALREIVIAMAEEMNFEID